MDANGNPIPAGGGRGQPAGAAAVPVAMQSSFTVEPFDRHKMKWSRWVERLEGAFLLFGVGNAAKLPMLLHYMGSETYDVLSDKIAPERPRLHRDWNRSSTGRFTPSTFGKNRISVCVHSRRQNCCG